MKFKNYKLILVLILLFVPIIVLAQALGQSGLDEAAQGAGFVTDQQRASVPETIVRIINGFLSILGMVFIYFIIAAGFSWMTSGGNAEKVLAAKTTLKNAFLGIFIVMISYALTIYIINALSISSGLKLSPNDEEAFRIIVCSQQPYLPECQ